MRNKGDLAKKIGIRLKELRQDGGLTLEKLAVATDLSSAFLSRIENGLSIPSIPTLQSIADALSVNIGFFFRDGDQQQYKITYQGARKKIVTEKGYEIEILNEGMMNPFMEPAIVTNMRKDREPEVEASVHEGQEFMYVIEGKLELILGGKKYALKKGDAAYWNGSIPHKGISVSQKPARTLNVHLIPGKHIETFEAQSITAKN
jgi:transcriptional regulator with XRE-family HTH domain